MFRVESLTSAGVPVIAVHGPLDYASVRHLEEAVMQLMADSSNSDVLIDLTHTNMVDSAGLGTLVKAHKACVDRGGILKISGVNDKIAKLLGVTHLTGLFGIYDNLESGVASFPQARV